MKKNILNDENILFIIFFLLTIGNSKYISDILENKIEFIGLAILLVSAIIKQKKNVKTLIEDFKIIILSFILSYGAFFNNISSESSMMILLSSILLFTYPKFARNFVSENNQIKVIGNALLSGMMLNCIIGIATGTLGLSFNSTSAIIKVLLPCGLKIKNYCGGIWMIVFISYYIYYYRNNTITKHKLRFLLLFLLMLLSGSKGACVLTIIFLLCINFKNIVRFKNNQDRIFYTLLFVGVIFLSLYIYNNILINIPTYAYRMRGLEKLFNLLTKDLKSFIFGISDIAYANTGFDYTTNMRNYLGWEASVEMAYVNILIKNGFIGIIIYLMIFKNIINKAKRNLEKNKDIVFCLLIVMILTGFTETYIASVHFVVGPALFCLIYGINSEPNLKEEK